MVALAVRDTVQEFEPRPLAGIGDFYGVTSRSPYASPPGTRARDRELRDLDRNDANSKWRGARSGIIKKEAGLPWEVKGKGTVLVWGVEDWVEVDAVAHFQAILQNAHFGAGWQYFIKRLMRDYYTQDFGALIEVIGPGPVDGPIQGAVTGLAVLDSLRCFATGNLEHPFIYYGQITGQMHRLHRTRIIRLVDMPDGDERFYGAGECALSRYIATAWREILMTRYIESRLDDKPPPGIMAVTNATDKQRDAAFAAYRREQSSDELPEWGKTIWFFGIDPAHKLEMTPISFSQAPEKFDLVTYSNHDVNELALAFNTDKNEIWELAGGNLGSGQQAEIQAQKARGKVIADFTSLIERSLNIGVLPDGVDFAFKTRDEAQDKTQADRDAAYMSIAREMSSMGRLFAPVEIRRMLADQSETFQQILTDDQGQVVAPDVNDIQQPRTPAVTAVDDQPMVAAPAQPGAGVKKFDPHQPRATDGQWTDTGGSAGGSGATHTPNDNKPASVGAGFPTYEDEYGNTEKPKRWFDPATVGEVNGAYSFGNSGTSAGADKYASLANEAGAKLDKEQLEAFSHYTGDGYKDFTAALYQGRTDPQMTKRIAAMDRAFADSQLKENVWLYRGSNFPAGKLKVGQTFADKSYVSTSVFRGVSERYVAQADYDEDAPPSLVRIKAKKGQRALFSGGASINPDEYEVTLPRDTTFTVTRVRPHPNGEGYFVDLEIVE